MSLDLSLSAKRLLTQQFAPSTLRELAALMESERPGTIARRQLSDESIDELAEMLAAGLHPTVGWWRRRTAGPE